MSYLYEIAISSINIRRSKELRRLVQLSWDQYKLDSREFIRKDPRLGFIWSLNEIQLIRENLNTLDKNIQILLVRKPEDLANEYFFYEIEDLLERLPKYIKNYKEFPFFCNVFGLYVFFQQLFNNNYSRSREKTAKYFVQNHPEIIEAYAVSPEHLVFVGREILKEESQNLAKAPGTSYDDKGRLLVTYPRFTNASLIKTEIKRKIRQDGLKKYVDITRELITLELHPEIITQYKSAKTQSKTLALKIPNTCNPFILLLLLDELTK